MIGRRTRWSIGMGTAGWLVAAVACGAAPTSITMEVVWGKSWTASSGFEPAARQFEAEHPDIKVNFQWDGYKGGVKESILAGAPPDIIMVPPQGVASWAFSGLLQPLDPYLQADNVKTSDFIPPAWAYSVWHNHVYAMTLETDPNFALLWNKDLFAEAGLDPDRGPQTLAEYQADFQKLTRYDGNKVVAIADQPWSVFGNTNTVFTWGWIFGGEFYDPKAQRVTANDPSNVEALTFLRDLYQRYAPYMAPGLSFQNGNQAMVFMITNGAQDWARQHPGKMGIGFEPYRAGFSEPNPAWLGGWAAAIPTGAKHPKEAWQFLRYLSATKEGTAAFAEPAGWMPVYLPSPVIQKYLRDPIMSVYAQIAVGARHHTPSIPVIDDYGSALDGALSQVLAGKKQPKDALDFVTQQVQMKLDEALAKAKSNG